MRLGVVGCMLALGCAGSGPYGYARTYEPLTEESRAASGAREFDPVMAQRFPDQWAKTPVSLFGVVTARAPGEGGRSRLTLSLRRKEPRNLCANGEDASSCRVTVTDHEFGVVHVAAALGAEDDVGPHAVAVGSLVRVVAKLLAEPDAQDGAPVLSAVYLRHWPRHFYVTRASADTLRQ